MTKVLSDKLQGLEDCMKQILSTVPCAERESAAKLVSEMQAVGPTSEVKGRLLSILPQQKVEELVTYIQTIRDLLTPGRDT
jgi:hypothetical protein